MDIKLKRLYFTMKATEGRLEVYSEGQDEPVFTCATIEDTDRHLEDGGIKIPKVTCIPRGSYEVIITKSNRFHKDLPLLLNVEGFTGVRIHTGKSLNI